MSDEAKIILKDMQIEEMRKEIISQDQFIAQLEKEYGKEIERLSNIINEFDKWLENEIKFQEIVENAHFLRKARIKLQELKVSDKK